MKVTNYIVFLLLCVLPVSAQNVMTSSPYSMFGIGEISNGLYGQNAAMGNVAYGIRNPWFINIKNPAGLTGLDSCKLIAEASGFTKHESYKSNGGSNNSFSGNISAFMLGGRIMPRWYMAASITPYSSSGYYFKSREPVEGTASGTIESTYEGSGGLSKASLSNAILLLNHISIGINMSYIFGNITQKEEQESMSVNRKMKINSFYADFGIQYQRKLNLNTSLTVGAVYGYKNQVDVENTTTVTGTYTGMQDDSKTKQNFPMFAGLGGSLVYKHMTYALDYTFHQYSSLISDDSRISFKDTHELNSGICYFPNGTISESFWKKLDYKAGINVLNTYMNILNQTGFSLRTSAGIGFPVINGRVNTALFYEKTKFRNNKLENSTFGFILSYTIGERFYKIKL